MNNFKSYFFKKYSKFSGRATRGEFWFFVVFSIFIGFILWLLGNMLDITYSILTEKIYLVKETDDLIRTTIYKKSNMLEAIFGLIIFIPFVAIGVRRLHDIGKSGWWYLIIFIPVIGVLVLLFYFLLPSEDRTNRHGSVKVEKEEDLTFILRSV